MIDIDKYYCLNLVEAHNRHDFCKMQFNKLELDVNFWYTTRRPIMQTFGNQLKGLQTKAYTYIQNNYNPFTFGAVFSCVFEHYNIIKQAYERGMNNIIIFEDDIKILINKNDWQYCIEHLPEDFSICKFHYSGEKVPAFNTNNDIFIANENKIQSTLAYAISRNGMEQYIYYFENDKILCADLMFKYLSNKYINNVKICEPAGFKSAINCKI